ncbi:bifunctional diaminohydroxyphosphoribosylaminopyrimidine deaminase/5-amino-6-(5-phosphoribosylamino)uracil reductase RibD [Marinilactibacillus piezotolerans]|uniref:bifunctional diaminohydroxyphosphoribosylaminopyrimidine deaminase/5-amino-6-(5-phosphoribosylamino)uracil reductase RibD n=1 Tax=Marinilactibacillus piezotolerans TaxID=258723 RepID=UPI0009AF31E6|nr:bifunctional diaminohydroxyphosphoribosylaminopyrimidine deaminase/5-amino-6-(5-phosphoribosylamino)uracil reductase RibD [Marinilactibacillus piezotolerans]
MDKKYMNIALVLAEKGKGFTAPNPLVGAVIIKNEKVIGQGYHQKAGGPHAEVHAINNVAESVEGATMYVTLEPCSHYGKTPPCVDLIIKKKIKRVVVAATDPNPLVSGRGLKKLKEAGIEVTTGVLEQESNHLNEVFNKYITTGFPFVVMKYAMTLDGKIATETGDSKWISSKAARNHAHLLRGYLTGIMVGIDTVLKDDPQLTCRVPGYLNPTRIVLDSRLRIPEQANLLKDQDHAPTIILTTKKASSEKTKILESRNIEVLTVPELDGRIDLKQAMNVLGERGIDSILLEGGGTLNGAALEAGIVDKVNLYVAPKLIAGEMAISPVRGQGVDNISETFNINKINYQSLGKDLLIEGYLEKRE